MKLIVLTLLLLATLLNGVDGNYVFKLESATKTEIDNSMGGTPQEGMMIFNTTDKNIYNYNGVEWVSFSCVVKVLAKTASYTLALGDNKAVLTFDSTTDVILTIPAGFPVGYNVSVYQLGTGKVSIVGSGTIVLNRLSRFKTAGKDAGVGIVATSIDKYHVTGDLKK